MEEAERVKQRIPIGTEITPLATATNETGRPARSTVLVEFEESEILERERRGPKGKEFLRLSLSPNPTEFDAYLVAVEDVESIPEA